MGKWLSRLKDEDTDPSLAVVVNSETPQASTPVNPEKPPANESTQPAESITITEARGREVIIALAQEFQYPAIDLLDWYKHDLLDFAELDRVRLKLIVRDYLTENLVIMPASKLSEKQRQFIRAHRTQIIDELRSMSQEEQEAIEEPSSERAAIHEYDGHLDRSTAEELANLDRDFHAHLFGDAVKTNCCAPRHGRYCAEGLRLREQYYQACRGAEKARRQTKNAGSSLALFVVKSRAR